MRRFFLRSKPCVGAGGLYIRIVCALLLLFVALFIAGCNDKTPQEAAAPDMAETVQIVVMEDFSTSKTADLTMPTAMPTATPTAMPTPTQAKPLAGIIIGIDPGHQQKANNDLEPQSPKHSQTLKRKVSPGTKGFWSKVHEYEVVLSVALLLQDILVENGATVIMTRTTHDVDISNIERALIFNDAKTDYALRIHCNGSQDQTKKGASVLVPKENPFKEKCDRAAEILLADFCTETGILYRGLSERGDQTGFNWCDRMIINIEMGYMSNRDDDAYLTNHEHYIIMAQGLANGIIRYFETEKTEH